METTHKQVRTDEGHAVAEATHPHDVPFHKMALALASAAIVLSALHFWPFGHSKIGQMALPPNVAAAAWLVLAGAHAVWGRRLDVIGDSMPHVSVLAFLTICLLSTAFARDPARALVYNVKSCLVLVAGYALISSAISSVKSLEIIYCMTTIAVVVSTTSCLVTRYGFGADSLGFHGSAHKYGTYVGMLAPLCAVYLLQYRDWRCIAGTALLATAVVSCATFGAVVGLGAGMATFLFTGRHGSARSLAAMAVLLGGAAALVFPPPAKGVLRDDLTVKEEDAVNLRQRYIEWQAQINLLGERTVTGTGAGSINDYRSEYYYRLPKFNTLDAFDQNGWLACGAEMGVLGLVSFGWIILAHFRKAVCPIRRAGTRTDDGHQFAAANLAGLTAACAANLFSSVHYNGILVAFALVLALISRTQVLFGGWPHASD
jgi:O-antigen ligase